MGKPSIQDSDSRALSTQILISAFLLEAMIVMIFFVEIFSRSVDCGVVRAVKLALGEYQHALGNPPHVKVSSREYFSNVFVSTKIKLKKR